MPWGYGATRHQPSEMPSGGSCRKLKVSFGCLEGLQCCFSQGAGWEWAAPGWAPATSRGRCGGSGVTLTLLSLQRGSAWRTSSGRMPGRAGTEAGGCTLRPCPSLQAGRALCVSELGRILRCVHKHWAASPKGLSSVRAGWCCGDAGAVRQRCSPCPEQNPRGCQPQQERQQDAGSSAESMGGCVGRPLPPGRAS